MSWEADADELRARPPRHLLFLCVANSARSRLAEAIARALAPPGVKVSSAGSRPSAVNPLAVRVLVEIGVDAAGLRSKHVDTLAPDDVDAVITLCAEEVCPAFLGKARRFHWGLPDPAAAAGSEGERLDAFRRVRDELRRRIALVFSTAGARST